MANQAWQITSPGSISLANLDAPIPKPGPKQALIRIRAVAYNYRDILVVDHSPNYPGPARSNLIPCSDGAGIIEEIGPGSTWKKGDHVIIHPSNWLRGTDPRNFSLEGTLGASDTDGTLRRWMVWDYERLIKAPEGLTLEESSTLWCAGVTAYRALFHGPMPVRPGMTVLTQGTGGVSCFGIQLAAAAGATVIGTSSSDEKLEVAKKLGAKHLVNYRRTPEWSTEVLATTGGIGVDLVLDVVGAECIKETIKATRFGGAIVTVGILSKDPAKPVDVMMDIFYGSKTIVGNLGAGSKEMMDEMSTFIAKHQLHPQIAEVFDFEEADTALEATRSLSLPGKVVVKV